MLTSFYPTALKGCRGIVFTHGVRMGGGVGGGKKIVRAISLETVRCRKLICSRDIRASPTIASFRKKLKTYLYTKAYPP